MYSFFKNFIKEVYGEKKVNNIPTSFRDPNFRIIHSEAPKMNIKINEDFQRVQMQNAISKNFYRKNLQLTALGDF